MPYIKQSRKDELSSLTLQIQKTFNESLISPGDLNYLMTSMALEYISTHPLNYQLLNDVIGVYESSKLEFYRRMVASYETNKIAENGDVY